MFLKRGLAWLSLVAGMPLVCSSAAAQAQAEGIWEAHGYGRVISIDSGQVQAFDLSRAGCVLSHKEPMADLGQVATADDKRLLVDYGINRYEFRRLDELPEACRETGGVVHDPLHNFDSVWHTFNENYAFFDARGVDWSALRQKYRARLSSQSSPGELYEVIDAMLEELGDGHVDLDAPDEVRAQSESETFPPERQSSFELQQQARAAVSGRYLAQPNSYNSGIVRWGLGQPGR